MATEPDLVDRVRKLLALAASPNVHEAASAAALAQTLIARHRLQFWLDAGDGLGADPDPITDARDAPLDASRRIRKWKVVLASALADANGCVAYTLDRGNDHAIILVGRSRDRASIAELWSWLVTRIEWLSATHGTGQDRAWHEAFRIGCVSTIAERLSNVSGEVRSGFAETALVHVDATAQAHKDALDRFVNDRLRLGKGRGIRVDGWAWAQGRNAAEAIALAANTRGLRR